MILISRHSIWKTGSQRLNFAIFCDLESDKSLKCRHHSENRKSEPWRKLFINAHFELNVYFSLFSWIVFSYSEEYWFVMAAFLYERKKYCICKRVGGLVEQILPNKQKVTGSSLTEADILRGSAFKFQIGQIQHIWMNTIPSCRRAVPCRHAWQKLGGCRSFSFQKNLKRIFKIHKIYYYSNNYNVSTRYMDNFKDFVIWLLRIMS